LVKEEIQTIFVHAFHQLCPRTPLPPLSIEFFPFANVNNTIRLREGQLRVRLSDLLEGAPQSVLRALAHILLAKLYRKPVDRALLGRFRRYVHSHAVQRKAHLLRQVRGRKHVLSARGEVYDLEEVFDDLNRRFFGGLLAQPRLAWSRDHARSRLGQFDPAHNTIVISRIFDAPSIPHYAVEYIVYHEMLHLKYPVRMRVIRRSVHTAEFRAEERRFPRFDAARRFLRRLAPHCDADHTFV
jgi:predicted metal-dependent hydrolase